VAVPTFELWLAEGKGIEGRTYYFYFVIPPDISEVRKAKKEGYGVRFQRLRVYVRFKGEPGLNPLWASMIALYTIDDDGYEQLIKEFGCPEMGSFEVERDIDITGHVSRSMGLNAIKLIITPASIYSPKVGGKLWLKVYGSWVRG